MNITELSRQIQAKERPILFSGPMVRAILDGRKVQTRRVMKPQPPGEIGLIEIGLYNPTMTRRHGEQCPGPEEFGVFDMEGEWAAKCPYGQPGDRLWVRETWMPKRDGKTNSFLYRADDLPEFASLPWPWKPSIHMPRAACRILLEITDVRAERLQDISGYNALAEGIDDRLPHSTSMTSARIDYERCAPRYIEKFRDLWQSINGPDSWNANPWVWVIEFKRIEL